MAKKTKEVKKAPKTPKAAPAVDTKPQPKAAPQAAAEEDTVTVSKAAEKKNLLNRAGSGLSMDGQVRLLDLAQRHFIDQHDPDLQYPQPTRIAMNRAIGAGILATLAEHAERGENQYAAILQTTAYPALEQAATDMGIKLPKMSSLPAPEGQPDAIVLTTDKIKVSKDTKEQIKHEIAVKDGEAPELDPTKITSEEDVTKALEYIFTATKGKALSQTVYDALDFIKKFRLHEAEGKEETIKAYELYNAGDWLDDIFSHFKPTVFFKGIGFGMESVAITEQNPIHAFLILRDALKVKETGKPALSDDNIAFLARSIVKWVSNALIESNEKAIENLDPKKNGNEIATCQAAINYHKKALPIFTDPSTELADTYLDKDEEVTAKMTKHIVNSYYGAGTDVSKYANIKENVKQHIGIILNYFCDPAAIDERYSSANLTDLVEYTEEELAEIKKQKEEKNIADRKAKAEEKSKKN